MFLAIPSLDIQRLQDATAHYLDKASRGSNVQTLIHVNKPLASKDVFECWLGDFVTSSVTNIGVTPALHQLYQLALQVGAADDDFILFSHDDVEIMERNWDVKVEAWLQERPNCVLFGFGGARGLGDPDLYTKPYVLQQLARRDFISNLKSAEQHGRRVTVPTQVATLDLFTIGAKVSFLKAIGGWAWWPEIHHSLDNAICCEAAKLGKEVWMFPIACEHFGGMTSTRVDFTATFGESEGVIHSRGHEVLYERYKGILPLMVN